MRNARIRDFKKELVLKASHQLFAEKNFERVTVDDIAQASEFSKATLYTLFESKEEILCTLLSNGYSKFCTDMQAILDGTEDTVTALDKAIDTYYKYFRDYLNLVMAFVRRRESGAIKQEWAEKINEASQKKTRILAEIITKGIENGSLAVQNPAMLARVIEKMVKGVCTPGLVYRTSSAEDDAAGLAVLKSIIFHGILQSNRNQ